MQPAPDSRPACRAEYLADTPASPFPLSGWLRIGLLLFTAQALALGLQALLLLHKEHDLLVGITVSRIAIAADQVQATFQRSSANGLLLAESAGIRRLLPRLQAEDPDIRAIRVLAADGSILFDSGPSTQTPGRDELDLVLKSKGAWSQLPAHGPLRVGLRLADNDGEVVGGVLFEVDAGALSDTLQAARHAAWPRLLATLAGVAAALPLLLAAAGRWGGHRAKLRLRILVAALLLALSSSLALSLQTLPSFSERLAPALDAKARTLAATLAGRISTALSLGIPFERLNGVEAYFDDALAHHPEILSLRLQGPVLSYLREHPGEPGHSVEATVTGRDGHPLAQLTASTDSHVVHREMRSQAIDLAIVFLVAVVLFNETLGAILAGDRLDPASAGRGRLGLARLAVFLLILSEELTRAFLPLHIAGLAQAAGEHGATAIGLPISAYMASFALLTPFAGRWAERFGTARTFALGSALSATGFGWALAGGGYAAFVAARCLCAAGYAIGTMAMQQYFLRAAADGERARALALFVGAVQTAAICGAPIGGLLAEQFGAAAVFAGAVGMSVLALLVQRLDRLPPPAALPSSSPPLLELLFQRRVLAPLLTAALPAKLALAGFLFYLVPLALQQEGFGSGSTGRAMMLYFLLVAASNPLASWLADRYGWERGLVLLGGLVIGIGGLAGLLGGAPALFAGIAALGVGTGLSAAALQAMLGHHGPAAVVLLRTVERLGAVIGPLLAGSLLTIAAYGGVMATIGALVIGATLGFALLQALERKAA
ncbi:MFS transporter [Zoogloea sp. LCSB751]|uniref:MFS transporter n=1 Tax=Zoogloea sp. LCSB751 TaxID=1965277 RepID=UPI0009A4E9EA|nr:MFS transporter [Zoogloea sp. LCSB751]